MSAPDPNQHRIRFTCEDCGARWTEYYGWTQETVRYKVHHDCPATHNIGPISVSDLEEGRE